MEVVFKQSEAEFRRHKVIKLTSIPNLDLDNLAIDAGMCGEKFHANSWFVIKVESVLAET
jgi:hypothetical protein